MSLNGLGMTQKTIIVQHYYAGFVMLDHTEEEVGRRSAGECAVLQGVGGRVRQVRAARKMSRKALAEASGVSERYLAQVEAGKGNISVVLLVRIAQAAGVDVRELLVDSGVGSDEAKGQSALRVALIGLRGAGKSTLGRDLAHRLGVRFLELNQVIEDQSGLRVPEIFNLYGAEGYRRLERKALEDATSSGQDTVLAVAGGIVEHPESYAHLLSNFRTVWLRAHPDEHMARVRGQGDLRPMQGHDQALDALKSILQNREAKYADAEMQFVTSGLEPEVAGRRLYALVHDAGWLASVR